MNRSDVDFESLCGRAATFCRTLLSMWDNGHIVHDDVEKWRDDGLLAGEFSISNSAPWSPPFPRCYLQITDF